MACQVTLAHEKDGEVVTAHVELAETSVAALDECVHQAARAFALAYRIVYSIDTEAGDGD